MVIIGKFGFGKPAQSDYDYPPSNIPIFTKGDIVHFHGKNKGTWACINKYLWYMISNKIIWSIVEPYKVGER